MENILTGFHAVEERVRKVFESKKGTVITASNLSSSLNRFGFSIDKDKDSERVIEIKKKIEDAVKSAKG